MLANDRLCRERSDQDERDLAREQIRRNGRRGRCRNESKMIQDLAEHAAVVAARPMASIRRRDVDDMRQRLAVPIRGRMIQRIAHRVRPALEGKEERDDDRGNAAEKTRAAHDH